MKTYKRYHTNVKLIFALGIENQLLPESFIESIPKTSSHEWKKKKDFLFYGSEYEDVFKNSLGDLKVLSDERVRNQRMMFVSFCRLYLMLLSLIGEKQWLKIFKDNRRFLLSHIENVIASFGDKNLILKLLRISSYQFGQWKNMRKYECKESLIWLCYKRISRQISMKEILKMKKLLNEKRYLHWSSGSVWGKAVKDGKVRMSLQSWYRYSKLMGLGIKRKKFISKRKRTSVRASKPNEIWHMDVTRYKTSENITMYIYTVMDNFSRKVLAWDVSNELSGKMRLKSLKKAIEKYFYSTIINEDFINNLDLIVDGGKENNNLKIHDFITDCKVKINKKVALKDVLFSNSLIEGNNRILKQTYLRNQSIGEKDFRDYIDNSFNEYNSEKPHYFHKIYTPDEIFEIPSLKSSSMFFEKLNKERIKSNKQFVCIKGCL